MSTERTTELVNHIWQDSVLRYQHAEAVGQLNLFSAIAYFDFSKYLRACSVLWHQLELFP